MKKMATNKKIEQAFEENKREAQEIKDFVMPSINKYKESVEKVKELYNNKEYKKMFNFLSKEYNENLNKAVEKYEFVEKKYGACKEYRDQIDDIVNDISDFFENVSKTIYENNDGNKYLILNLVNIGYDIPKLIDKNNSAKIEKERKQKKDEQEYKQTMAFLKHEDLKGRFEKGLVIFLATIIPIGMLASAYGVFTFLLFVDIIIIFDYIFFELKLTKWIIRKIRDIIKK